MRMAETLKHNLRVEPYDYQKEGILAGLRWHRFLIGDEPGLGKTLQSIGVVDCANAYPCLVVCPSSLKINWQREFEKFTNKKALVLDNSVLTIHQQESPCARQFRAYHMALSSPDGHATGGGRQLRVSAQILRVGHQGRLTWWVPAERCGFYARHQTVSLYHN